MKRAGSEALQGVGRQKIVGTDEGREHRGEQGGKQPAHPPRQKQRDVDRPACIHLSHEFSRDQETADDEEHVDADEPSANEPSLDVEQHHENDGDRSQPLNLWSELGHALNLGRERRGDTGRVAQANPEHRHKTMSLIGCRASRYRTRSQAAMETVELSRTRAAAPILN